MANVFTDQENAHLHPSAVKMRQRLQSAPEKLLKSPTTAKAFNTPRPTGRKAFGAVNKTVLTPAVNPQEKKLLKTQEAKAKHAPQMKVEYPEIEKFIPYNPLEFESYSIPEDVLPVGGLALSGLACFPPAPHLCREVPDQFEPLPNPSPVKMAKRPVCSELDAFLHTLDELTIELPPESD